jgi:hypothetical protein
MRSSSLLSSLRSRSLSPPDSEVFLTRVQADTPGWMMMTSTADIMMISSTIPHETRITNGLYLHSQTLPLVFSLNHTLLRLNSTRTRSRLHWKQAATVVSLVLYRTRALCVALACMRVWLQLTRARVDKFELSSDRDRWPCMHAFVCAPVPPACAQKSVEWSVVWSFSEHAAAALTASSSAHPSVSPPSSSYWSPRPFPPSWSPVVS